ncbi:EamA family transporter RarD [Halalkalibacter krulwichiae]|uniref:Putative DMT superfamily transporter inner membrane protein n=1 Tax=Halalkalibacter krulwichiae TaxID=199441 RepID=A0A1X9MHA9_9BACI|nr:EamA family transporter RarD [Halalkalibacter krulwichiae]ARK32828.1 putative DMT superfamily transporter inner membrane protein [Halalkalibacter krulwichiae]
MLAHRVIWSLLFMVGILAVSKQLAPAWKEFISIFTQFRSAIGILLASSFISINWFIFIWAVNSDHVIEASLGYYINPLLNVLLGVLFLKESLTRWQIVSFSLAFVGVGILTMNYGAVPWAALSLGLSFALYGLFKKLVNAGALVGLTIETLLVTPIALLYLYWIHHQPGFSSAFSFTQLDTTVLLVVSGVATAVPLLLFAIGARRISLSLIGFLQYIAPTIMLLLGIFLFNEPFSRVQFLSFLLIWIGLILFTTSKTPAFQRIVSMRSRSKDGQNEKAC